MRSFLFIIVVFFMTGFVKSDIPIKEKCKKPNKKCKGIGNPYRYSMQSRSAHFTPGMSSEFRVVLYSGLGYNVTICAPDFFDAYFLIRKDDETRSIIFDSSNESLYQNNKEVETYETRNVIIEVVVPEINQEAIEKSNKYKIPQCVYVVIEYIKIQKTGFN